MSKYETFYSNNFSEIFYPKKYLKMKIEDYTFKFFSIIYEF